VRSLQRQSRTSSARHAIRPIQRPSQEPRRGPTRPFGKNGTAELLNAGNGRQRVPRAEMDYAKLLRDLTALAPNAVTEAIVWRVKPATMRNTSLNIVADIVGSVRSAQEGR
jgi:hypothetical protein